MKKACLKPVYSSEIERVPKVRRVKDGKEILCVANAYGRLTLISNSMRGDNGALLSTFEQHHDQALGTPSCHPIFRSDDRGRNWRLIAQVRDEEHPHFKIHWMPTIFEMPRQVGEYPAGTLLMGAVSNDRTEGSYLRLYVSNDTGVTWKCLGDLDHGGFCGLGVWEPFFVLLDDGTLVCHYCDERNTTIWSQKLVCRSTRDLVHWTLAKDTVASGDPTLRPGMPVVTRLGDKRYFMVYEVVGMEGNPVHCRYSDDGLNWGDPKDIGQIVTAQSGATLGSCPYCQWIDRCGSEGILIVSGGFMRTGTSDTGTDYFVSYDQGKTWETWPHPIPYSNNDHISHTGYSNSCQFCAEENRLYSICNRGTQDGCTAMTVAVSDLVEYEA